MNCDSNKQSDTLGWGVFSICYHQNKDSVNHRNVKRCVCRLVIMFLGSLAYAYTILYPPQKTLLYYINKKLKKKFVSVHAKKNTYFFKLVQQSPLNCEVPTSAQQSHKKLHHKQNLRNNNISHPSIPYRGMKMRVHPK